MPQNASTRSTALKSFGAAAMILVLTWIAMGGIIHNGFVNYDDDLYLTANPSLACGLDASSLQWALTTTRGGNWHPATWLSHLVDARFFGLDPSAHHAVSLALHAINALLLLALLLSLTGNLWPSALVAVLFAVHPLHVESVAWAAERKDVLATLFEFGAALAYVRRLRTPAAIFPRVATMLLFALALMSKPMPITLPLVLLLLDWWPLGRWSPHLSASLWALFPPRKLWLEKAWLFVLAVVSGAITWTVQSRDFAMQATALVSFPARAANALISFAEYLRKAVWPSDLGVFYPYPWAGHTPQAVVLAMTLLVTLCVLAMRLASRRPWLSVGLLWYFVGLLPVIGIVQVGEQAMADRYTYVPLVGVFLAAAWEGSVESRRGRGWKRLVVGGALASIGMLAAITMRQVRTWHDSVTLFSQALSVTQDNYIAHNNLGTALLKRGEAAEALQHFEATIRADPTSPNGYQNSGLALSQLGRHEEAVGAFRESIARKPDSPSAHRGLGQSLERLGRRAEALGAYETALRLQPRDPRTLDVLGVALARDGRPAEAVPLLEAAARLDPENQSIREHLAVAIAQRVADHDGKRPGIDPSSR